MKSLPMKSHDVDQAVHYIHYVLFFLNFEASPPHLLHIDNVISVCIEREVKLHGHETRQVTVVCFWMTKNIKKRYKKCNTSHEF